jgi:hypothetical protein
MKRVDRGERSSSFGDAWCTGSCEVRKINLNVDDTKLK